MSALQSAPTEQPTARASRPGAGELAKRFLTLREGSIVVVTLIAIVYFSVKWWNSLHQQPSNPGTVSKQFYLPLRMNAFGTRSWT